MPTQTTITLPPPKTRGDHSLEDVLRRRRSIRELATPPLTWEEIGQLLWAAQGVTSADGFRTTPSAGALYPMEVYVATAEGVFHYEPAAHAVTKTLETDVRAGLRKLSFDQACLDAPCIVVMAAVVARVAEKYPEVADISTKLEVGHAMQNLLLQVTALGLASVPVGAFNPPKLGELLRLPAEQEVMYLAPVGRGSRT
jgi:SagB-type dehydrogenase family enzyme